MATYSSAEVKAGFFITFSLVLLISLTFIVGTFLRGSTKNMQIEFGYVGGLEDNAPVYFAGREVGKVDAIEIVSGKTRPILVTISVADHVVLREDSKAYVDTLGMMGEKLIELTPGSNPTQALAAGSTISGVDPIPMYRLVQQMDVLATRMDEMTEHLNPIIKRVDGLLADSEEDLSKTISNLEEASANVRDMTHDLKFRPWRLIRKNS